MKKIIVTGGAGFIGANLASYYLNQRYKVLVFDNLSRPGSAHNLEWLKQNENSRNLDVLVGDVVSPPSQLKGEVESSDAIFHLAAQVAVTSSVTEPRHDFEVNAQGTFNLLELVRESKGMRPVFFYASTNKVYGEMDDANVTEGDDSYSYRNSQGISEDCNLDFHSPYGCSKGCADQYVRDYARIFGLKTVVFRQSCIYGYRQFGIEDQGWVAWFVIAAVLGKPITIFGDGKQVRDILFIDDLMDAFDKAWENISHAPESICDGGVYNIGGGSDNAVSLQQLIALLQKEVNPSLSMDYSDWRPGDQRVYISDITRAERDFGWRPRVDWVTGVRKLIDWVRENEEIFETPLVTV